MEVLDQAPLQTYAELFGRVVKIIQRGSRTQDAIFVVHTQTMNRDFTCQCPYFCPVQEGDSVYAVCTIESDPRYKQILKFAKPPFVQISMDKDSVLRCFIRILRGTGFGNIKAHQLFDKLSRQGGSDEKVISTLSELAALWNENKDEDLFIPYTDIVTKDQIRKLLFWWHKHRSLRRLYLFGLTNTEIEACKMPCDKIYEKCLTNPYVLVPISIEKCDEILQRQNKTGTAEDRRCAQIVRKIYSHMKDKSWTGTPTRTLLAMFPDTPQHMERLKSEYGVVADLLTAYLEYPYKVETFIANKVENLVKSTLVTPEMPMETRVRESANFLCKTLNDEQKAAIQGALDNNISIITGGAGVGKTLIIGEIVHNLELRDIKYCIGSFTGKAVSRIREVIKRRSPATMHRLIARSNHIPKFGHLIIDEASMVTTELLYQFLRTFPHEYKITLVGDANQLQPIEWGSLLEQLIKSQRVPTFKLSQNHRLETLHGMQNGIMINANALVDLSNQVGDDDMEPFDFVTTENFEILEGTIEVVYDIIRALYQAGVNANDVTVITPYNKELDELNKTMQQIYNEMSRHVLDSRGKLWCVKDRVMLLENNYNINVYNGEEGMVVDVSPNDIGVMFRDGAQNVFKLEPTPKTSVDGEDDGAYDKELTVMHLGHCFSISIHKCVSEDTYIFTDTGMKQIKDLYQGTKPIYECKYNVHGRYGIKECVQVFKGVIEPSIKIKTQQGFLLEGSHRHPILIVDDTGNEVWKKLPEIKIGDRIVMRKGMNTSNNQYVSTKEFVIPDDVRVPMLLPKVINEDISYLFGQLIGDGNYTDKEYRVEMTKGLSDEQELDDIIRIVKTEFELNMTKRLSSGKLSSYIYNKMFRYFLDWCGLGYQKSYEKSVPWVIFNSPLSCQAALLSGLYDSDGGVNTGVNFTTTSEILGTQVQQMLLNFGIICNRSVLHEAGEHQRKAWRLHISGVYMDRFRDMIGFRTLRKKKLLDDKINSRTQDRQLCYDIPNSQQIVKELREEIKKYHNMKRYTGHPDLGSLFSRIISGKSKLHDFHLAWICQEHPKIGEYGPRGKYIYDLYSNGVFFDTITEIIHSKCQMYDLYINDDSHSFISNGFVSHNSQGSEWPYVIIFIPPHVSNSSFLTRNLLYTAITRAKRKCWIVTGDVNTVKLAAMRAAPYRCENLAVRLVNPLAGDNAAKATTTLEMETNVNEAVTHMHHLTL